MNSSIVALCLLISILSFFGWESVRYLVPFIIKRASRWGILDFPNTRKTHNNPTPRLGGLALTPALWLGSSLALLVASILKLTFLSSNLDIFSHSIAGFLVGSFGFFLLGSTDDVRRLSAGHKMLIQFCIALIVSQFLPAPSTIFGMTAWPQLSTLVFILWLTIIPNSVNLLDGIDGLTASLVSLCLLFLSVLSIAQGELGWLLVILPLTAALLSFLRYNWAPASIFLGDSGSLLLGFTVAYLSLNFALSHSGAGTNWNPAISVLIAFIWISDTVFAIIRRYSKRTPKWKILNRSVLMYLAFHLSAVRNIVYPDQGHIHHKLLKFGLGVREAVFCLNAVYLAALFLIIPLEHWGSFSPAHPMELVGTSMVFIPASVSLSILILTGGIILRRRFQNGQKSESFKLT